MVSRRRILGFAIGKMLRQDGWAEKYNPKNQFHVNQYDYSSCKGVDYQINCYKNI